MFPEVKALELRGFEFFQHHLAQGMYPSFDFGFWKSRVLQLIQSIPAIIQAAIALGTLHEAEEGLGVPISKDRLNEKHKFAVGQYNESIKLLTEQSKSIGGNTVDRGQVESSVLATCLIFVHLDLMRGLYKPAGDHIKSGLKILEESGNELSDDVHRMMKTAFY